MARQNKIFISDEAENEYKRERMNNIFEDIDAANGKLDSISEILVEFNKEYAKHEERKISELKSMNFVLWLIFIVLCIHLF
jgi:hypothetical protein